mgnify:CR=1 FL=1
MCGGGGTKTVYQEVPSETKQTQQLPKAALPFLYGNSEFAGLLPQAYELSQQPMQLPETVVAGRTPTQVAAEQMALESRGSYMPALAAAQGLTGQGVMATEQAGRLSQEQLGAAQAEREAAREALTTGLGALEGTGEQYDPTAVEGFMNPYEQAVIDTTLQDIARSGQMQLNEARAQAARSGAFGGARMGIAESEIARNILGEQARTAGALRQQGFEQAAQRSQAAFEAAQQRQQGAAGQASQIGGTLGQLGTSYGQLGQQAASQQAGFGQGLGALGAQMAGFGQQQQGQQMQDINTALTIGQQQQGQEQAFLDAARQNQYQATMAPYQQLGFFSDIFVGAPTGTSGVINQQQTQVSQQQSPNPVSQLAGLGMAAYGLSGGAGIGGLFAGGGGG